MLHYFRLYSFYITYYTTRTQKSSSNMLLKICSIAKLAVKSKISDWRLPAFKGTIITGSSRSGTTLALRVYCPDLTADEEKDGSIFNEPQPLCNAITQGNLVKALLFLPLAMQNRHYLIKSPQIAVLLPYVKAKYSVIVTYRDLRLTVPSMLRHHDTPKSELAKNPYWAKYVDIEIPDDPLEKAILTTEQFYKNIIAYRGPMEIWNYEVKFKIFFVGGEEEDVYI